MTESILHPAATDAKPRATGEGDTETRAEPGRSVRQQLALFAGAMLLPIFLFSAFLVWTYAASERSRIEGDAADTASAIAVALDRDLTGVFAALDVLSTSAYLRTGDLVGFKSQAEELFARQQIVTVLTDLEGQQLVNVRVPAGTPLPRSSFSWDPQQLATVRPFVTDLVTGQVTGRPQFLAALPIQLDGANRYVLFFSLSLERLQRIIRDADVPIAYTASIIDRQNVIMARSTRSEEFVGRTATRDLIENTRGRFGSWSGTTADGTPVFGSYRRSSLSDFRAAVGIRYADLNAPLWRSLSLFGALFVVVAGLSGLLAVAFGKRIASPLSHLARAAREVGRGKEIAAASTGLAEADEVSAALAASATRLREREAQLRDANEEIQRFAYIVSHDLRSPLVNIMGFTTELEALRGDIFGRLAELRRASVAAPNAVALASPGGGAPSGDDALGADFDEAIGFIKTSIAKMDRLINSILALSRADRRPFAPARVSMDELIANITAGLATQAERAEATIVASPLPDLVCDQVAIEQIFSNLVDNALKYLRHGVPGRIEISGETRGRLVVYAVRDNGRGIDAKDRQRVFELFRRSGVQDRPGEGIGLAHVRALVRRMGGTIGLTSEPGRGSTFTVTLPRRPAADSQRKAA